MYLCLCVYIRGYVFTKRSWSGYCGVLGTSVSQAKTISLFTTMCNMGVGVDVSVWLNYFIVGGFLLVYISIFLYIFISTRSGCSIRNVCRRRGISINILTGISFSSVRRISTLCMGASLSEKSCVMGMGCINGSFCGVRNSGLCVGAHCYCRHPCSSRRMVLVVSS